MHINDDDGINYLQPHYKKTFVKKLHFQLNSINNKKVYCI